LTAVVALGDRSLGPPRGGSRLAAYPDLAAATRDAARLARAMSIKFAVHGLPFGGAKAVLIQDHAGATDRRLLERRLRAYGRFLERLGEAFEFGTGPDFGFGPAEVAVVQEVSSRMVHADSLDEACEATAAGARVALEEGLARTLGGGLAGRRIAVQGVGAVGGRLARQLAAAGARVLLADTDGERAARLAEELGDAAAVVPPHAVLSAEVDALAPCARGGVLTAEAIAGLRCAVVAGAANNQLADPEDALAEALAARGVLFVPDPVVSGGAALVLTGCSAGAERRPVEEATSRLRATVVSVLDRAEAEGVTPHAAAHAIARERIRAAREDRPVSPAVDVIRRALGGPP
jgi:leucine dehydrogenase